MVAPAVFSYSNRKQTKTVSNLKKEIIGWPRKQGREAGLCRFSFQSFLIDFTHAPSESVRPRGREDFFLSTESNS